MVKKKSKFPQNNLTEKYSFVVNKKTAKNIESRCDELELSASDYIRGVIQEDLERHKNVN